MKRKKQILNLVGLVLIIGVVSLGMILMAAPPKKPWDGMVHAPLKTAQPFDWSADDMYFTGDESADIQYIYVNDTFEGQLKLKGFKQAGPYVLTVDTADGPTLAGYDCDVWEFWAQLYGETFVGGINGCWYGSPFVDIVLFSLERYDSNLDGIIDESDFFGGSVPFDIPLLEGVYNLKYFVKLDWHVGIYNNIMMVNDMIGDSRYGKVVAPKKGFNYDEDLVISCGLGAEKLVLADDAWCVPSCKPPNEDPGYIGTTGVVFYLKVADTFRGTVVLSQTVTPPTPQPLQIKLEGMGSQSPYADSNEWIGYLGRWWDNNTNANISDSQYEAVKDTHNVLGYVVFDGLDTSTTTQSFSLDSSYHTLWTPESVRPAPGNVTMSDGFYVTYFALTENTMWWRGVFMSENPLEFTIEH